MDDTLQKIHLVCLDLLEQLDTICRREGIEYTLSSGSLLGAVRHKGFIPWDDDVDVAMTRDNYNKFLQVASKQLDSDKYFVEHYSLCDNASVAFAKIRNNNTTFVNIENTSRKMNHGISIDVFPIDKVPDLKGAAKLARVHKILYAISASTIPSLVRTVKSPLKRFLSYFIKPIGLIWGYNNIMAKEDKSYQRYNDTDARFTTADIIKKNKIMPYEWFKHYTDVEFEGRKFRSIANYDGYLSTVYGDYMTLPPEDKRVTHLADLVDPDRSYKEYLDEKGVIRCKR